MAEIALYYFPLSFYSQKARLYLLEKGVPFADHVVDLLNQENLSEWYLGMNPAGKVPLLKHGQKVIPDSHDIYLYGEEHLPGACLLPAARRDEVLALHNEIHSINAGVLTYGCLYSDKYSSNVRLTPAQKESLKANMSRSRLEPLLNEKIAKASPDMVTTYASKKEDLIRASNTFHDPEALDREIEKLHQLIPRVERQLEKTYDQYNSQSQAFLFSFEPTIADIDLVTLLVRLRLLGLDGVFLSENKTPHILRFMRHFESRPSYQQAVIQAYSQQSTSPRLPHKQPSTAAPILYTAIGAVVIAVVAVGVIAYLRQRQ